MKLMLINCHTVKTTRPNTTCSVYCVYAKQKMTVVINLYGRYQVNLCNSDKDSVVECPMGSLILFALI